MATVAPRSRAITRGSIEPHWLTDHSGFWYRNQLSGDTQEFIRVQVASGQRSKAFDHVRLAQALSQVTSQSVESDKLPFDRIAFSDNGQSIRFEVEDATWSCNLSDYTCTPSDEPLPPAPERSRGPRRPWGDFEARGQRQVISANGQWEAYVQDDNVFIRSTDPNSEQVIQLSTDGDEDNVYTQLSWAPEGPVLVGFRMEPGDDFECYRIESSPRDGGRAKLHSAPYSLPGDKFNQYELNLFNIETQQQIKPQVDRLELDWQRPQLHWLHDGRHFAYDKIDRGHQRFRVIEVDAVTGDSRTLIDQQSETFIWTAHTEMLSLQRVNWLENSDEILYVSEQDGWRHLYLIDTQTAPQQLQITKGEWVVRGIDKIDEENRQIWFQASGMNPDQDPYFIHYYRVNFDGTGLVALTEGNGTHSIQYSPDGQYLIDTYSRVDQAPIHNLRKVSDGTLVCALERADISELMVDGWRAPEVFVAKGRDGATDIWGVICRPKDLDPHKKYPVLENIYAGPQGAYTPKSFSPRSLFSNYTDKGFIVVQMDAMGTGFRSKAFHDVCWHNLKDAGFPDRILWHQAAAKQYPYYDTTRVGLYGTSAGAQNAAAGVLFHPEFYKAAVASCGCHDNRMDKASWNEQWMGYPVGPQYNESSNIDNASLLQGYLMLIVGEMDNNVPPENTYRFADALIKADKDFDLVVIPGANHSSGGPHGERKRLDFFIRHLQGLEIPNHNVD